MSSGFGQQRSWHGCTPHHVSRTTSHHASAKRTHAALGAPRPWPPGTAVALIPGSPAAPITEACLHQVEHCHSRGTSARPLSLDTRVLTAPHAPALAHACCTSTTRAPLSLADAHASRLPRASLPFCGGRDPHIYAYGSQARTNAAHPYFQHFLDQLLRKPAHLRSHRG